MRTREKLWEEKDEFRDYLTHINWDWWFLKGQLIFAGAFIIGVIFFFFWISE